MTTEPLPTARPADRKPADPKAADRKPADPTAADPKAASRAADQALAAAARHSAGPAAALTGCAAASAATALAEPALLGHTLDLLLARDAAAPAWTALCAALITADVLLDAAAARLTGTVGARSTAWLRTRALGRLLTAAPHHAARFPPGDLAARLTAHATEAGTVPATAAGGVVALLPPLGGLIALFLIDLWTALAFLAGMPLLLALLRAFARDSAATVTRYQQLQLGIARRLAEALGGARTIAAAGTVGRERARILRTLPELSAAGRHMWRVYGGTVARSTALLPLLLYAVIAVAGFRLASGALGVGDLVAAARYAALAAGLGAATGALAGVVRGRTAARRTAELLTLPELPQGTARLPAPGTGPGPAAGTLDLDGVTVVRDGVPVLSGITLHLPGGTHAVVVGGSGSGKSTLAAVAGRLTAPDRGRVLLDGVPLEQLDAAELRREVTYAFAGPALFAGTDTTAATAGSVGTAATAGTGGSVGSAIAFGASPPPGPEAVVAAARAARADSFVRRLPDGYDTPLAEAPLSGGEAQRIGLARAFCRTGRLLILDDATSSLDTVTAHEIDRALGAGIRSGTRITVAHRASSAARADLVVWLEQGRLRAVGRHRELWQDPHYRAVFAAGPEHERAEGAAAAEGAR
ncbi:ABC transporter ATP-binding protein [Streptomyces venezuelae]|uniref:ABC transporter ATP-binding protein n=1 Tax=Streptomyces venezuelae TaxID=54571 RepID=A0A5P2CXA4_STRVZ|nr:ABC transporter ATP-binding protein [Streptomyces venezuelae]QES46900.1 ABC transporter ATP-binding protein [Streptomyces venezuelae]